jgi:hypothetical protein
MYSKLYYSMLVWYGQWYSNWAHQNLITALALTITMMFNLLFVVNLLTLSGIYAPHHFLFNKRIFSTFIIVLTVAHLIFVNQKAAQMKQRREEISNLSSKKIAIFYMAISFTLFLSTFIALTALRIHP